MKTEKQCLQTKNNTVKKDAENSHIEVGFVQGLLEFNSLPSLHSLIFLLFLREMNLFNSKILGLVTDQKYDDQAYHGK